MNLVDEKQALGCLLFFARMCFHECIYIMDVA